MKKIRKELVEEMKVLKSTKGKIAVAIITAGLIFGTGFVFANTDIGQQLRAWYEALFNQKSEEVMTAIDEEINQKGSEAREQYYEFANEATDEIHSTRDDVTASALSAIETAKNSHLENLNGAKEEILEAVGVDFYQLFLDGYFEILRIAEEGLNSAREGLTAHTGAVGEEALNQVTQDLTAAKEQAVAELEDAIEQAKAEITEQVNRYAEGVNYSLVKELNFKYEEVINAIEEIKDNLVEEQKAILTAAAQELEAEALAAMEEVINNIGNN